MINNFLLSLYLNLYFSLSLFHSLFFVIYINVSKSNKKWNSKSWARVWKHLCFSPLSDIRLSYIDQPSDTPNHRLLCMIGYRAFIFLLKDFSWSKWRNVNYPIRNCIVFTQNKGLTLLLYINTSIYERE